MTERNRSELGDFLRARRARLDPEEVGVTSGRRRRTQGLRREEVAERAGIGVDWYIRLEQGRAVTPSTTTVGALARALLLSDVEHEHLKLLARTSGRRPFVRETVPEALRHLVESLPQPAYVTGRRWDVLAWNAAAAELFTDFGRLPEAERNILLYVLTGHRGRALFGEGWSGEAKRMIAQFRPTHDLWAGEPAFAELVRRLKHGCAEFDGWWTAHDVRAGGSGHKVLQHPLRGELHFDYATFQANEDPALKLAIYCPAPMP